MVVRKFFRFLLLSAFLTAAVIRPTFSPAEECGTQGALALAMAQLIGIEAADQESAVRALEKIGVEPYDTWIQGECLTQEVVRQIDKALRQAVAAGLVGAEKTAGTMILALEAIGEGDLISGFPPVPPPFFGSAPPMGGPPLEGSGPVVEVPPESVLPPPPPPPRPKPPVSPAVP